MADKDKVMIYTPEGADYTFRGTANDPKKWVKTGKDGRDTPLPRAIPVHPDVAKMFADHKRRDLVDRDYQKAVFNTRRDEFVYNRLGAVLIYIEPSSDDHKYSPSMESIVEPEKTEVELLADAGSALEVMARTRGQTTNPDAIHIPKSSKVKHDKKNPIGKRRG